MQLEHPPVKDILNPKLGFSSSMLLIVPIRRYAILICLAVSVVLGGCMGLRSSSLSSSQDLTYPAWFWKPPSHPDRPVAVGYAPLYFRKESSLKSAVENAVQQLAKQTLVQIKGEQITLNRLHAEQFEETVADDVLNLVKASHLVLASYQTSDQFIVLAGIAEVNLNSRLVSSDSLSRPDWMSQQPKSRDFFYGVGHFDRSLMRTHQSWHQAERNARIDLAQSMKSYVRSLYKEFNGQMDLISSIKTERITAS